MGMAGSEFEVSGCRVLVQSSPRLEAAACRDIVQWLPHAVVLIDAELRILLANRAACSLFGAPATRLRGVPITALLPDGTVALLVRDLGERPQETETSLQTDGGVPRTLKISAVRLPTWGAIAGELDTSHNGRQPFGLLVLQDIGDRAALEQLLLETEKQAAIGQLAAGILHEVANPLTSIGSNLLFVRRMLTNSPDEVAQALNMSLEQLDQMRQLLGTLSGLPGRPPLKYELADLHEIIRRCIAFVAKEAERRRIRLAASFAPSIVACEMDVRSIKQVLLNLLKNAMEAMPEGGRLEVRTSYRAPELHEPAATVIEVEDTGLGIAEADLRKVFRPLFSTKPRGAGLGLSFCRQTVEEHGGEIRLTSRGRNQGTVAIVSLPVRQAVTADE
jgi:PAS domain S-box-containing protein